MERNSLLVAEREQNRLEPLEPLQNNLNRAFLIQYLLISFYFVLNEKGKEIPANLLTPASPTLIDLYQK